MHAMGIIPKVKLRFWPPPLVVISILPCENGERTGSVAAKKLEKRRREMENINQCCPQICVDDFRWPHLLYFFDLVSSFFIRRRRQHFAPFPLDDSGRVLLPRQTDGRTDRLAAAAAVDHFLLWQLMADLFIVVAGCCGERMGFT
jgi:hypothetical protein